MSRFMSDADIAAQYEDFNVTYYEIEPLRFSNGWSGTIEIEFPNADEIDFDSSKVDNFIVYDIKGERIAFEHWYPQNVCEQLLALIRGKIAEKL